MLLRCQNAQCHSSPSTLKESHHPAIRTLCSMFLTISLALTTCTPKESPHSSQTNLSLDPQCALYLPQCVSSQAYFSPLQVCTTSLHILWETVSQGSYAPPSLTLSFSSVNTQGICCHHFFSAYLLE